MEKQKVLTEEENKKAIKRFNEDNDLNIILDKYPTEEGDNK